MNYPVVTIESLCDTIRRYYPDAPLEMITQAYAFAEDAHKHQKRSSGEPYITHPVQVAQILAEMRLDLASIITGLLHDTVEDTSATMDDITRLFGQEIADLVDGVTKLSKMTFHTTEEKQAENFRKMVVAMAKDIRVILVKLADRLSNMRTLEHLSPPKQKRIAQETLDIYAPISNRLGISWIKVELEDLCLKYLHPDVYSRLSARIATSKKEREHSIEELCDLLKEKLKDYDIQAQVMGRAKHFYSIYKKMERRNIDIDQINDIIAFRIVVDNITECYKALGVIHALYKPIPGRIKDYIAMPKGNSYQSLHTTVIGPYGERVEIQIRTEDMNQIADKGIAAHWKYKEGRFGSKSRENVEWVQRLMEWQKDLKDPNEFLETIKIDLFSEDVFVFTPRGEVKQLPHGATPLDFAYSVHTGVGHQCIGAKVNNKIVPLKYRLKSGDTIEIVTSPTQQPSKDWLKIVRTSRAKAKIRAYIKQQERGKALEEGRELLDKALRPFGLTLNKLEKLDRLKDIPAKFNRKTLEEVWIVLGYGRVTPDQLVRDILTPEELAKQPDALSPPPETQQEAYLKKAFKSSKVTSESQNLISVSNLKDVLVRFAKCCSPLPGDSIIGFVTRGRGVTVHTANCTKALDDDSERRIDVKWNAPSSSSGPLTTRIRVQAMDEAGLLASLSLAISALGVNISSANIRTTRDRKAICIFDIDVKDTEQLQRILSALEAKSGIISVHRTRS